jgi:uncharacterized protein
VPRQRNDFLGLSRLAAADPSIRKKLENAIVEPLRIALDELREALKAQRVTIDDIPADLARLWVSPDGRARVQVLPKGDHGDTAVIRDFVTAVLAVQPNATGPAMMLFEAGKTIVRSIIEAAIFAVLAIALLLWAALRRVTDVLLTLTPLLVAAIVTLELCSAFNIPLNFANIVALPVLLGVGVAFKIYYIMAWRSGQTALVRSTLTRAVMFSATTTATGFDGIGADMHDGGGGVFPTGTDGTAAFPAFTDGTRIRAAAAGSRWFGVAEGGGG